MCDLVLEEPAPKVLKVVVAPGLRSHATVVPESFPNFHVSGIPETWKLLYDMRRRRETQCLPRPALEKSNKDHNAKEFAGWQPPQPSLEEIRSKLGGPSLGDDELLMRYVAGNEDVDTMRIAGAPKAYSDTGNPLLTLVQELSQRKDCSQIYVQKGRLVVDA